MGVARMARGRLVQRAVSRCAISRQTIAAMALTTTDRRARAGLPAGSAARDGAPSRYVVLLLKRIALQRRTPLFGHPKGSPVAGALRALPEQVRHRGGDDHDGRAADAAEGGGGAGAGGEGQPQRGLARGAVPACERRGGQCRRDGQPRVVVAHGGDAAV